MTKILAQQLFSQHADTMMGRMGARLCATPSLAAA